MQKLYGLAEPESAPEALPSAFDETAGLSRVGSVVALDAVQNHTSVSPCIASAGVDSFTPDFDRALGELQASMDNHEDLHHQNSSAPCSGEQAQDPFALSLSAESMGGSGGLIAWSKNLKLEDVSPDVTLANFLRPL
jgi:hypothetical protein